MVAVSFTARNPAVRESDLERRLGQLLTAAGFQFLKLRGKGLPDRAIIGPSVGAFCEIKSARGKLSDAQNFRIRSLAAQGQTVIVASPAGYWSANLTDQVLAGILRGEENMIGLGEYAEEILLLSKLRSNLLESDPQIADRI